MIIDTDRIKDYKDIHTGPCVILGNGPSILNHDLSKLIYPHIGVNRSWRLIRSRYHAVADIIHLVEYFGDIWDADYVFTWRMPNSKFEDLRVKEKDDKCIWIKQDPPDWPVKPEGRGPWSGYSGICAIELGMYMGYDPVYLLGFDLHDNEKKFYKCEHGDRSGRANNNQRIKVDKMAAVIPDDRHVYNCNKESALTCFEYRDVEEVMG